MGIFRFLRKFIFFLLHTIIFSLFWIIMICFIHIFMISKEVYVMRSSELSLVSGTNKFKFCTVLVKALRELWFSENPLDLSSKDIDNFDQLKTIRYKKFHTIIACISKLIFPTYDGSFCLITSHILMPAFRQVASIVKKMKKD